MIMTWVKKLLPDRKTKGEIQRLRHQLNNDIQAVQSGNRVLQSMSGMIELSQRGKPR